MYAIIETGGKQYRVEVGDTIDVELLETQKGQSVEFPHVLFVNKGGAVQIGTPHLAHCVVRGEMVDEVKGPKEIAFKYKQRKPYRRKVGHRQRYTQVKITEIKG